jgi:hypothetical protein
MPNFKFIIPVAFTLFGCSPSFTNSEKTIGYKLSAPDARFILPDILREISGLTSIDSTSFACIQDENGILFIYDAIKNKIKTQYNFNTDGDYEEIARIGKTLYILQSDGTLFEISDYESKDFKITSFSSGIPAKNNEGLCYDLANNRLLIASKGRIDNRTEHKDKRVIYGFDLKTKTLSEEPAFDFDLHAIKQFAISHNISLPTKTKKDGEKTESILKFRTSAICIHPFTKKLYLLSASDHLLFIFSMNGNIEHIEQLNPKLFNKAEGITFFENGDMLITNEGQDKKPTLLRFNYLFSD